MSREPIELTRRYATTVDDMGEVFDFILEHKPLVGGHPRIEVNARQCGEPGRWVERLDVSVSGMEVQP